ncbi:MAG: twin-arginine translocation signal domain-containing protein [Alloacidobacterium sp.]
MSSEKQSPSPTSEDISPRRSGAVRRRSFLKGLGMAGATLLPASALLMTKGKAQADERQGQLTKGDVAILRLLAAAEIIETDLWQQYNELGGIGATGSISQPYITDLQVLDGDMPQYIADNTDDEMSHVAFLNAFLASKGEQPVNFDAFRNIPPSKVTGVPQTGRHTNLQQLSVDTSWWVRYRSTSNPDLGTIFTQQAVQGLNVGQHPAIPVNNADLSSGNHLLAIAFTAGFHFGFIEQAGTSLYATLSQKVTSAEVLKITISIGGSEIMHFQVWHDKAGNATPLIDQGITFVDLTKNQPETLQANLIMPEPCDFISTSLPQCAIIRPTSPGQLDATGAIKGFIADGLFIGQQRLKEFQELILDMAAEADAARRELEE